MSRRSLAGAGLVVFGAGIYLTGPTGDVNGPADPRLPPLSPMALMVPAPAPSGAAPATIQTAVGQTGIGQTAIGAPFASPSAPATPPLIAVPASPTANVATPPQATSPVAATTPRMINPPATAPKSAAARPIPAEGPRNSDLPPATSDGKPSVVAPKPVEAIVPPLSPSRKSVARKSVARLKPIKPAVQRASRLATASIPQTARHSRGRVLIVADAAPPPRVPPPPRVQW